MGLNKFTRSYRLSYSGISVKEALNNINKHDGGWYLPQVQRQYVWGDRDQSEEYICLLLDSILKGYPIGGVVLWETEAPIPHRPFLTNFVSGERSSMVDSGLFNRNKYLIYDGQQRLQTLYSVLRFSLNKRVLCYDLLFNQANNEADETGFYFIDIGASEKLGSIKLNTLCAMRDDQNTKVEYRKKLKDQISNDADKDLIEANLDLLWETFVKEHIKSIAYFVVKSNNDSEVNEIFRRLNTGGVALTQAELVLSKISAVFPSYEFDLVSLSNKILASSQIDFSPLEILQLIFLLVKGNTRVDAERVQNEDIPKFVNQLVSIEDPLNEFFEHYLWGLFKINNRSIIPRGLALLPIICYFIERSTAKLSYQIRRLESKTLEPIHQYFILSQVNDWNTQTMVSNFTNLSREAARKGHLFPLEKIKEQAIHKGRIGHLKKEQLLSNNWFTLKILAPNRQYQFLATKPQIDHIFPKKLDGQDDYYKNRVDILWNLQPIPAEVNNYKRARHPQEFLKSEQGSRYYDDYDFLPKIDDALWSNYEQFLEWRETEMINALSKRYGLALTNSTV